MISSPNTNIDFSLPQIEQPCINNSAAAIANGSVVARDESDASTARNERAIKRINSVISPASGNVGRLWGILQTDDGRPLREGGYPGRIVERGLALARVRVPASTNLATGTQLVMATTWNAGSGVVDYYGYLEPVIHGGAIWPAANPMAVLKEDLTASGSDTVQMAYVEVLGPHRPRPFAERYTFPGANTTGKLAVFLFPHLGPGVIEKVAAQLLTGGTGGDIVVDCKHKVIASTPVSTSVFTTPLKINNDATDGAIAGLGCDGNGDSDNGSLGTGGTAGVYAAVNKRQFITRGLTSLDVTYNNTPAGQSDLMVVVSGLYY